MSNVSRRGFLKGMAAAGTVVAASSLATTAVAEEAPKNSWENGPAPIAESDIVETYDCEICIVGAGNAGVVAALTAAEDGADVIVLQNKDFICTQGTGAAAYNSKHQQDLGIAGDFRAEMMRVKTAQEGGETNPDLLNVWFDNSGAVIDWICEHAIKGGMDASFDVMTGWEGADHWLKTFPVSSMYGGITKDNGERFGFAGTLDLINILAPQAEELGARFIFNAKGEQLVRDADGRVSAVLAKNAAGKYIKVNASKGIVLCTGGYEANPEMRDKWLAHANRFPNLSDNDGSGLKMGIWVGAAVDAAPHASNIHYNIGPNDPYGSGLPWLRVSVDGKRFCNEDVSYGTMPLQDARLREAMCFQILDADMDEYYPAMTENGAGLFRTFPPVESSAAKVVLDTTEDTSSWGPLRLVYENSVQNGYAYKADTLAELAALAGIDADELQKTVDRYNDLYDGGVDLDYGTPHARMQAIRTAPFFAIPRQAYVLGTLGGLVINTKMQVLDTEGQVIPGLYAAGNTSGGKFFGGMVQSMSGPAMTVSRAQVWGRLAVKNILAGE